MGHLFAIALRGFAIAFPAACTATVREGECDKLGAAEISLLALREAAPGLHDEAPGLTHLSWTRHFSNCYKGFKIKKDYEN